jgi:filamentous hemagglutinin family protein
MNRQGNVWALGLVCWLGLEHLACANPTGGQVAAGSAGISGQGTSAVTIKQASNLAIINWQTFSIASGESTTFLQPSVTSAALNRVIGGQTSNIDGTLKANGSIYLVNGNGIVVGPNGVISANAFTASTRDIADADFLSGKFEFAGSNNAGVQNFGKISALGGDVVLIGKTVSNAGTINARHGTAGLVAGDDVLLGQKNGDGSTITVSPDLMATSASTQVGVNNSGKISAAAAELKAANGNIYALAIQNSGTVRATTVRRQGGHIWLTSDTGSIVNSGTLDASATAARGKGGTITMKNMGGTTTDSGKIMAQGGQDGTGGNAEVSGNVVQFTGAVDLTAPDGATGDLLIDPTTLEIVASGGTGTIGSLPASGDSTINASSLVSALNGANITLNANNSISVNAAVNASGNGSAGNLILDAPTLNFNAPITLNTGSALSGNATTVNVGAAGQVQNGVDAAAAGATVNLAAATYDLTSEVVINKNLTVQGSTTGASILNGQNETREMEIDGTSSGDTVTLNNLTLTDGNADAITSGLGSSRTNDGGGLLIFSQSALHATVTINNSTISNNTADNNHGGGGIYIAAQSGFATVALNDSTVSGNSEYGTFGGGGIYNDGFYGGVTALTITNSTIANNTAAMDGTGGYGGAIYNEGAGGNGGSATVTVINSTISGNSASNAGGGIYNDYAPATLTISDTILAGNTANGAESDVTNYSGGTVTDHGYNLYGQNGTTGGFVGNGTTDIELAGNINTVLTPLGNYGGPTQTMALVAGSPAYLAGGARGSVTTDQRGAARGSVISIGAWDYNPTQFTAANSTIVNTASDAADDIIGGATVSLRDALFYSNVGAVTNPTITFNTNPANGTNFSTAQTISLTQGELLINKSITVDGSTTGSTSVSGQNATRELEIDGTSSGDTVTVNNLTLTNGNAGGFDGNDGGGLLIYSESSLHTTVTINNSTISNNTADGANGGGGIYIAAVGGHATVSINDSTISGNSEYGQEGGGGIYNDGYGGGTSVLTITNSTITNNTATIDGTGGYGGAIYNEGAGSSSGATLTVSNSTISGNSASNAGGGIYNDYTPATLTIGDTILAGNMANGAESDVTNYSGGTVTDHGYNLYGQNGTTGGFAGNGTTDIELSGAISTVLAPLGNYGGPTATMALVAGSPAYLAGGARGSVTTDQRGAARGSVISIGAWDYNPTQFTAANSTIVNTASDAAGDIIGGTTVSLRDALFYSNVGAVTNPTITFSTNPANGTDFSTAQTIALTQGELLINKSITVDGSTTGSTIVNGQNQTREMEIDGTSSGDTVTVNNLTLTDGNASSNTSGLGAGRADDGGGLLVYTENSLDATVAINNSTISNNVSPGNNGGGGIYIATSGSGVATVTVNDSTISGNASSSNNGGGIVNDGYGGTATLNITDSTIANNTATGNGGGIFNEGNGSNGATLTINNSTVSGNSSGSVGGGIYNDHAAATLVIGDTIVAGNTASTTDTDLANNAGTLTDHGYNLFDQGGGYVGNGTTDIEFNGNINTLLTPLGNYGGPTQTMALVVGSPAYLAGGARGSVTTDQRGVARGSTISIGAWDYNPTVFTAANSTIVNTASDAAGDIIGGTTVSLRDALFYSNVGAVTNPTITFNTNPADGTDFSTAQTIALTQGELLINKSITVDGSTTGSTSVSGQNATRELEIDGTSSGITVNLNNLTLTDGNAGGNTGGVGANRAGDGGGLLVYTENSRHATVNVNDSTISNNTAPNTNGGGGIYIAAETGFGTVNIDNSTISGNTATLNFGGGIYSDSYQGAAVLTIANTTIVNNTAYGNGGGIFVDGRNNTGASLTISNSTISGNSSSNGGGIYNLGVGAIMIGDTILSGNTVSGAESDLTTGGGGSTTDNGHNLYGQNGNDGGFNSSNAVTIQSTDILLSGAISTALAPLGNYGGPTQTMALVVGSPAYLTGGPRGSVTTDQRGVARGSTISIGAYDGTLYLQISGATPGATDAVDVISDGVVLPYGTTASGNTYSIYLPESYATAGVLVTDVTGSPAASTYYSAATTPTGAVAGVNLGDDLLYLDGTGSASNTILLNTAGSLNASTYDINYSVNSGTLALTTASGVGVTINSPYTMDGDLTVGGTLTLNTGTTVSALHNASAAAFILQSGTWEQIVNDGGNGGNITGSLPTFADTGDFGVQGTSTFERFAGGSGTTVSPYQVTDVYGLQGVASPSNSLLGDSIVLNNAISATATADWNSGAGFVPIGTLANNYTGTFNGAGYTINGLTINRPSSDYIGLFGETGSGAVLENIGLTNETTTARNWVGGLVGDNYGMVKMSYSDDQITDNNINTGGVGGLAGGNYGTIQMSYSTGTITSNTVAGHTGGLVGENYGTLEMSYSSDAITAPSGQYIGGLLGQNFEGTVEACYSTGSVTVGGSNSSDIGGLVGQNFGPYAIVEGSYSAATVSSPGVTVGGLIGVNISGMSENNYWLQDTGINTGLSGIGSDSGGPDNNGATPETLAQLRMQSTFQPMGTASADWNFTPGTGVWAIGGYTSNGLLNNGLPYFQWQYPTIQLSAANQAIVYGQSPNLTVTQGVTYTVAGLGGSSLSAYIVGNPSLSISGANTNVGQTNAIVISATPASPELAVQYVDGIESFTPVTLTISATTGEAKTYGQDQTGVTYPSPAYTVTGLVTGDSFSGATLGSSGYAVTAGAGNYSVSASGGSGTLGTNNGGSFTSDYNIVYAAPTANALTVGAAALTVTPDAGETKTYGQDQTEVSYPAPAYTVTGLANGDSYSGVTLDSSGYAAATGTGSYSVTASGGTGTLNNNSGGTFASDYNVVYAAPTANALTVGAATLTVSANTGETKTYGENQADVSYPTPAYTVTGLVNGDSYSGVALGSNGYAATAGAGSYSVSISGGSGTLSGSSGGTFTSDYNVVYAAPTASALSVNPATLTIMAATGETKIYGENQAGVSYPTPAYSVTGLVNGDSYSGVTLGSGGYANTAGAGSYSVGTSGGSGTLSGNSGGTFTSDYNVVYSAPTANALTIGATTLTITADPGETKIYGQDQTGVSYPSPAYTVTGLVNGDIYGGVTLGSNGYATTAGAGSYSVGTSGGAGTLSAGSGGAFASDYNVVYSAPTTNALTVGAATVTIAADTGEAKTYGEDQTGVSYPSPAYTVTGLVNGDSFSGVTLGSSGYASPAGVGNYSVSASGGSGVLNGGSGGTFATDYLVNYAGATPNALSVNPATLTYIANAVSINLGQSIPPLTGTVTGFVNGESLASGATTGTLTFATLVTGAAPGSFAINGSGLSAANYIFVQAPGNAMALSIGGFQPGQPTLPGGGANPVINFGSQFNANANYDTLFTQSWFPLFDPGWNDSLVPVFSPVNVPHPVYSEKPPRYEGTIREPRKIIAFGSSFQYFPHGGNH